MKKIITQFLLISSILAGSFLLQSCQSSLGQSFADSMKGMREGPIDNAISNGQLRIGMSFSEVTGLIGRPTVWCRVKNQSSSSGNKKVWITDATSQVWKHRYELVFIDNKLDSWSQR